MEELTVSHDLEVERLQERLGQLQTVQDKLELALREKQTEHEKAMVDGEGLEEQKERQMREQLESAEFNLKESGTMLRDAKATLKREQKAKADAEEIELETRSELEELLREAKAKEEELQSQLLDEGTLKEQFDAKLLADRVQLEESAATLTTQLADGKVAMREAEAKATSFAKEYGKEFYLRKQIAEQLAELTGNLRVFCRVRAPLPSEEGEPTAVSALDDTTVLLQETGGDARRPMRRFEFSQVYGPATEQSKLFADVEPMITQILDGFNVCAIAYGGHGSGKTHTIGGSAADPGLLYRSVSTVFDLIAGGSESMQHEVFISMFEVVGELIRDLQLPAEQATPADLRIVSDATYGTTVEGLTSTTAHTASHVRSLIAQASATRAADESLPGRRGTHFFALVTVRSASTETGESAVGRLTLADLASPDDDALPAADADDEPHVPLASLHDCMSTLAKSGGKDGADFEQSKLTQLLSDPLNGNCKTMMIVTVSPTQAAVATSAAALAFGKKAATVALGPASKIKESMQTAMTKVNTTMSALTEHAGAKKIHDRSRR